MRREEKRREGERREENKRDEKERGKKRREEKEEMRREGRSFLKLKNIKITHYHEIISWQYQENFITLQTKRNQ